MNISEQDFNTSEEFFEYCSKETKETINSWTSNKKFKSKWDSENMVDIIKINDSYNITFDSGWYSLVKI